MLKKIFSAAILALFMLSSQIAFAANNYYDWSKVQHISSKSELAHYLESQSRAGQTVIPVVLTNGLSINIHEAINICPGSRLRQEIVSGDGQNTRIVYTLQEYPGTRVANAYLSGDTGWLSQDEMKLYKVAKEIADRINKADKKESPTAMSIYFEIMKRATYLSGDMDHQPRFVTAYGALIDGKANCQGYTDAFYMLGRMCGLNVGRIGGTANGGSHEWNTITYGDGKTYFIDVTAGDDTIQKTDGGKEFSYIYFNAPVEIMQVTHSWDRSFEPPNLQPSVDFRYSYSGIFGGNLARATSAEAGLQLLAKELSDGKHTWFSVMTPLDENYFTNSQQVANYISNQSGKNIHLNTRKYGKYMFFTAHLR